jgi:hypothetical protein
MNKLKHVSDMYRTNDKFEFTPSGIAVPRVNSKIEFFNDSGERIWEPLHNKTLIAGSALTAMKLFNLNRNVLDNTPTYETMLNGLDNGGNGSTFPTVVIDDGHGGTITAVSDESQRKIIGFCVGQGGAGLDISDVFDVKYCDCISPDNLIPFRYPLANADDVDENVYKGKKTLPTLDNGQNRVAYYFKTFSNTPNLVQNYVSSIGSFSDSINPNTVYTNTASADKAQSYVELHLKITKDDCREFFIAHKGIENAKINQLSLVSAWTKTVTVTKLDKAGNMHTDTYEYFQDIRPFSMVNIATEIMSDISKSISILYTLYF